MIRNQGGICIADEVQTGLGRTGEFWTFQVISCFILVHVYR